jgi:hypothetical protein
MGRKLGRELGKGQGKIRPGQIPLHGHPSNDIDEWNQSKYRHYFGFGREGVFELITGNCQITRTSQLSGAIEIGKGSPVSPPEIAAVEHRTTPINSQKGAGFNLNTQSWRARVTANIGLQSAGNQIDYAWIGVGSRIKWSSSANDFIGLEVRVTTGGALEYRLAHAVSTTSYGQTSWTAKTYNQVTVEIVYTNSPSGDSYDIKLYEGLGYQTTLSASNVTANLPRGTDTMAVAGLEIFSTNISSQQRKLTAYDFYMQEL